MSDDKAPSLETHRMTPSLRELGPKALIAGVLPFVGYTLLRPHVHSDATALAAVMVFPVADIAVERVRRGRFEPIGLIALIGIGLGLIGAVVFHGSDLLLKLRESVITGAFGLICLASLAAHRPAMFYMARVFATGGDPKLVEEFNAIWDDRPAARRRFKLATVVWGLGLVGEAILRTVFAYTLPTGTFLAVAPVLGWAVIGGLIVFSVRQRRAGEAEAAAALSTADDFTEEAHEAPPG
jgi:hypothetical protein